VQIPNKKTIFEFLSSISWASVYRYQMRKLGNFRGNNIGTKGEKLNFFSSNILNSPLVLVLNQKIYQAFAFSTGKESH
jgi:hypothetical protein